MPQHLTDITISEVSLVDAPANKGARVMLFKRDRDEMRRWAGGPPTAGFDYLSSITKKEFSDEKRKELAGTGAALPDGSFPIENVADLKNAVHAYGRAKDKAKAKAHIISRAKTLGATSELPEDWTKRATVAKDAQLFDDWLDDADARERACEIIDAARETYDALCNSVNSIMCDDEVDDPMSMLDETQSQYQSHVAAAKSVAKQEDNSMTEAELKKKIEDAAAEAVKKATEASQATIEKLTDELNFAKLSEKHKNYMDAGDMSDEQKKKFAAKSPDERDAHMADNPIEKLLEARLPESVRKQLAETADLKKQVAALRDKDELEALTKRATDSGLPAEFGAILQKAERGDKEALGKIIDKHAEVAKARDEALRLGGVFKEFGTSRGASGGAMDQLNVKRDELRKVEPSLTEAQAFDKVYRDPANRDLVAQEKRERMAKVSAAA